MNSNETIIDTDPGTGYQVVVVVVVVRACSGLVFKPSAIKMEIFTK